MTRNKITLTWIANDSSRKATLKKRRAGLFKKTKELSVLADVKSCAVVYSPEEDVDPAFFPSYGVVKGMFDKFMSMSMVERSQKMLTHEDYLRQRVVGEIEKRDREKRKNDKREAQEDMNKIFEGSDLRELDIGRLNKLSLLVVDKLKELEEREVGPRQLAAPPLSPPAPPPPPPLPLPLPCETIGVEEYLVSSINPTWIQELMNDNWFMETMALYQQDIPRSPSWVLSDFGIMPLEHHVAGSVRAGEKEEELPEDLRNLFPHS
ncbi:hypothetical protein RHSIM_Rhsim03G0063500 [Rhododendron simsii]|uniref:MADS-box domain-containing protein n=1 Tax=Rhododendron simsii TaxID=118357 RepID=A0A834H5V3_RHOSS|nr:hypothetical protein RHSIM_Rhsim03G0063500 [Rhododendron simsii]